MHLCLILVSVCQRQTEDDVIKAWLMLLHAKVGSLRRLLAQVGNLTAQYGR